MSKIRGSCFFAEGEDSQKRIISETKGGADWEGGLGSSDPKFLASSLGCGCCLHE